MGELLTSLSSTINQAAFKAISDMLKAKTNEIVAESLKPDRDMEQIEKTLELLRIDILFVGIEITREQLLDLMAHYSKPDFLKYETDEEFLLRLHGAKSKAKSSSVLPGINRDTENISLMELINKWVDELIFLEEQMYLKAKNKEYILAHNHEVRLEQVVAFTKDLSRVKADSLSYQTVRNKLTPFKNLIAMIENGLANGSAETHDLVLKEIEQCKQNIISLTEE
jgi:hypothetical protein